MLHNRKVYLYMVRQARTQISLGKAQLLMFLAMQKSTTKHYHFIPTEEGPFSLVLEDDTIAMLKKGLLTKENQKGPSEQALTIKAGLYEEKMMPKDEDKQLMDSILDAYQAKNEKELLKTAIAMKPFYGTHFKETTISKQDNQTQSKIIEIQKTIKDAKRALYTIGYEKISLDEFMLLLLLHGIQTVIDVRETTTSRRREFSKHPLEQAFNKVGLDYISMPEVGIPSEIRNKILKDGDHQDLLVWYSKHVPQKSGEYAKQVATAVKAGNTALMCYEKDPKECHRTPFAQFCKETHPEITNIIHLRDFDEPYLDTFL
ncbi:MAG TPA: DUF488 domain-containing protein [Spirochaetales bacterium]|jgi:hypothetical protein|nr:DUF488 domain-containing protein [Spirochaetales bacterium]